MRRHPKIYRKAGISRARLLELEGICQQYHDYEEGRGGKGGQHRIAIINRAAQTVAPDSWKDLIVNVADGTTTGPEQTTRDFYRIRNRFFIALHELLNRSEAAEGRADACAPSP